MSVNIVGAGAVGLLLGTFLMERKCDVTFIVRNEQQRQEMLENGIALQMIDGQIKEYRHFDVAFSLTEDVQVVLICTKYEHLRNVWPMLRAANEKVEFVFIQNGLSHYVESLQQPLRNISFGSAQFGAKRLSLASVSHRGVGVLKLATARGNNERVQEIFQNTNEDFPIEWQYDAFQMLFEKALLNCFINPLTTILHVPNGELVQNKEAYAILQQLYDELMLAFPHMKKVFPFEAVKGLCDKTAANTSSMLADRLAGRKTEIDPIVGEVIRLAQKDGHAVPILTTLYHLVKAHRSEGE